MILEPNGTRLIYMVWDIERKQYLRGYKQANNYFASLEKAEKFVLDPTKRAIHCIQLKTRNLGTVATPVHEDCSCQRCI